LLKPDEFKPSLFVKKQGELALSGKALNEFLRAVLDKGVPFRFKAKGFSMSPFIKDNDVITVSPLADHSLSTGKVVAFIHPQTGKVHVHRVLKKEGGFFLIKGDNSPGADGFIPKKNIMGFVTRAERKGKKIFLGLGPERFLIAFISSNGLFFSFLKPIRKIFSIIRKKGPQHG